jgi:hypothetical protein
VSNCTIRAPRSISWQKVLNLYDLGGGGGSNGAPAEIDDAKERLARMLGVDPLEAISRRLGQLRKALISPEPEMKVISPPIR